MACFLLAKIADSFKEIGGSRVDGSTECREFIRQISRIIVRILVLELVISEIQSMMRNWDAGDDRKWMMNNRILHGKHVLNREILSGEARKTPGLHEVQNASRLVRYAFNICQ